MKKLYIILLVLVIVVLGYLAMQTRANRPANNVTTISNGGYTWKVGAVRIDGTNVPAGQVHIAAIPGTNVPPETNESAK
jgi:hypothetical protein